VLELGFYHRPQKVGEIGFPRWTSTSDIPAAFSQVPSAANDVLHHWHRRTCERSPNVTTLLCILPLCIVEFIQRSARNELAFDGGVSKVHIGSVDSFAPIQPRVKKHCGISVHPTPRCSAAWSTAVQLEFLTTVIRVIDGITIATEGSILSQPCRNRSQRPIRATAPALLVIYT
jgi:hypothetical protein